MPGVRDPSALTAGTRLLRHRSSSSVRTCSASNATAHARRVL